MSDDVYLTRAGYEKLHQQLADMKKERIKIASQIEEARLKGDLSENAEYDAAKEAQGQLNARMGDLESKLAKVRIIEDENIPGDKVYIGAIVTLYDNDTDEEFTYMMVSAEESNFEENKISIVSPIGKGLMGKAEGETVDIKVPAGTLNYTIKKIKRP